MIQRIRPSVLHGLLVAALLGAGGALAQEEQQPLLEWSRGPGTAPIGSGLAEIELSENFVFLDAEGTRRLLELTENPVTGDEMATLSSASEDESWFVIFEWDEIGYVPDDEKDSLDADAILDSVKQGTEAANEERRQRGWATLDIVGWHEHPHYDSDTQNLTWAILGESEGHRSINRFVKLLGRRGVMTATLVADQDELILASTAVDDLLTGFRFTPGSTYAEYVPGKDQLARYGLTALMVGGGAVALAKSGLLARFWKVIVVGVGGLGAWLSRLFRRKSEEGPTLPA